MNATQHARAKAVIEGARLLCGDYLVTMKESVTGGDPRGYVCCALGELALAAGHTVGDLLVTSAIESAVVPYLVTLPLLHSAYGLTERECDQIATANDEPIETMGEVEASLYTTGFGPEWTVQYDLPRARKAAVLAVLDVIAAVPA